MTRERQAAKGEGGCHMSFPAAGFFGQSSQSRPSHKRRKKRGGAIPAADSTGIPKSETLPGFDSIRRMTFAQVPRSTLVTGGTGSGKTASIQAFGSGAMPPAAMSHVQGFHPLCSRCDFSGECPKCNRKLAGSRARRTCLPNYSSSAFPVQPGLSAPASLTCCFFKRATSQKLSNFSS